MKCFFHKEICLIIDDKEDLDRRTGEKSLVQEVFIFNASQPEHHGIIFRNIKAEKGKFISNILPITQSSYVIFGFTTRSPWKSEVDFRLLRIDYFNTSHQFEFDTKFKRARMTCDSLLYIEYTKYFAASFISRGANSSDSQSDVLLYDLTSSSKSPQRVFSPRFEFPNQLGYLEPSRVLLIGTNSLSHFTDGVYGYTITGCHIYQIRTSIFLHMVTIKASNFFAIVGFPFEGVSATSYPISIYNLQGFVFHLFNMFNQTPEVIYSEFFGDLLLLNKNMILRVSWNESSANPTCRTGGEQEKMAYSFSNKWCGEDCTDGAKFSKRGICEFYEKKDHDYLVYFNSTIPVLPTNLVGELFHLNHSSFKKPEVVKEKPKNQTEEPDSSEKPEEEEPPEEESGSVAAAAGFVISSLCFVIVFYICCCKKSNRVQGVSPSSPSNIQNQVQGTQPTSSRPVNHRRHGPVLDTIPAPYRVPSNLIQTGMPLSRSPQIQDINVPGRR